jgi:hypothetical protein
MKKKNNIYHLCGYKNLRFQEIRAKLLKYLDSYPFSKIEISDNKFTQLSHTSTTNTKTISTSTKNLLGETQSNLAHFNENLQKEGRLEQPKTDGASGKNLINPALPDVKSDARHHMISQQAALNQCPPSKEPELNQMVVWIILYMIHLILTKPRKQDKRSFGFDPFTGISNKELFEVFKSSRRIRYAKDIATASGILERACHVPNKYVDKFKIDNSLLTSGTLGKVIMYPCVHSEVITLLVDAREHQQSPQHMDDVTQYSLRILKTLRIRKQAAMAFIESSYQQEHDLLQAQNKFTTKALAHLQHRRDREVAYVKMVDQIKDFAYAKRDDFGRRLHSLFTQSPKRLRPFLYFERVDKDLFVLDLGNAQPLLFVLTLMQKYQGKIWREFRIKFDKVPTFLQLLRRQGGNEDVIRYITYVQEGSLYEKVHELLIAAQFKNLKPLFDLCAEYLKKDNASENETLTLIRMIHSNLKSIRGLLRLDDQNEETKKVLKRLFRVRKQNLLKPNAIDAGFVRGLHDAIARAYHTKMTKERKKKIKKDLCRHVFYGMLNGQSKRNNKPKPVTETVKKRKPYPVLIKQVFRESFPKVWNIIEQVKQFDYTALAQLLQGREANIFIDHILRQLIVVEKRPHFLSLHDGILCSADDVELLKERIAKEFDKWGLQLPLNIENITTGETIKIILNKHENVFKQRFIEVKKNGEMIKLYATAS